MYRIDIFDRKKDGNRGEKITSSWYRDFIEANNARFALKALKNFKCKLPHDAEAEKLHKPEHTYWPLKNYIVSDPVLEK